MTIRDRLVASVIVAAVAVGLMWVTVVSPKRSAASSLTTQISAAQATLAGAQQALASAQQAESSYVANVHAVSQLTSAVPRTDDEPGLLTLISRLAGNHSVEFHTVTLGTPTPSTGLSTLDLTFSF
jgi:Tfp pilus assembly protein PilO